MLHKIIKNSREVTSTAMDLFSLRYPEFVYGRGMCYGSMPVFCFHGVEADSFSAILDFIDTNGYATLESDEYYRILTGRAAPPRKGVVLTFDDGWGSLWSVGFPIIKKYGAKIIVFIPPGRIEQGPAGPNIDDLRAKKCSSEDVYNRDNSSQPLLTWSEILEMHGSGLVDFQSHSYNHSLVTRNANIVDFLHPGLLKGSAIMELPCPSGTRPAGAKPSIRLGEPLYETSPRLSDTPQFFANRRIAEACAAFVEEYGGEHFFKRENWRKELAGLANLLLAKSETRRTESPVEQTEAIRFELRASKNAIESMLPGKTVQHICYPWHVAGTITAQETSAAGYVSGFWGKTGGRYYNNIPGDPFKIARVSGDFFYRLPGRGRLSLFRILLGKVARRAQQGSPYLTH